MKEKIKMIELDQKTLESQMKERRIGQGGAKSPISKEANRW